MNRSISIFAKRSLLAAAIGLLAIHSPAIVLADELQVQSFNSQIVNEFNFEDADDEDQAKPAVKEFNIKIDGPPQTGAVDATRNHFIFAQNDGSANTIILTEDLTDEQINKIRAAQKTSNMHLLQSTASDPAKSPYWIGTQLRPLNSTMRWMMKLPEDQGVVLFKVYPGSSAEKVGLKERDIIIKVNDKAIATPEELQQAIAKSDGNEITIVYIRDKDNEEKTITIKPDKRPERKTVNEATSPGQGKFIHKVTDEQIKQPQQFDVITFAPGGFAMPSTAQGFFQAQVQAIKLPDDLSISVTRTGDKPAEIKVKKGDKTWEVTEKELDKLPEDVRKYVNGPTLLGGGPGNNFFQYSVSGQPATVIGGNLVGGGGTTFTTAAPQVMTFPGTPGTAVQVVQPSAVTGGQLFHKRIIMKDGKQIVEDVQEVESPDAKLQKQVQDLQKQIDEIRKQLPAKAEK